LRCECLHPQRGADGSDEVDLEFIGANPKSLQTVLWKDGKRVWYNLDPAKPAFDASKVRWRT